MLAQRERESDVTRFANQLTLNLVFLQLNRRPIDRSQHCRKCRFGASPSFYYSWVFSTHRLRSASLYKHTVSLWHSVWHSHTCEFYMASRTRPNNLKKFTSLTFHMKAAAHHNNKVQKSSNYCSDSCVINKRRWKMSQHSINNNDPKNRNAP